jgi:hypothetical protein
LKRGGVKVGSFVYINALTGQQIDADEEVFTATEDPEISGTHSQESHSA